jgi:hypothetical protein
MSDSRYGSNCRVEKQAYSSLRQQDQPSLCFFRKSRNIPPAAIRAIEQGSGTAEVAVIVTVHPVQGGSPCGPAELTSKKAPEVAVGSFVAPNPTSSPGVAQNASVPKNSYVTGERVEPSSLSSSNVANTEPSLP